jgi:hypothetical protein
MTVPEGLHWGWKLVGTDLATDNHEGGRHRYRLGEWHEATAPTVHSDPCPKRPGDGLCAARTLRGAQSGGARVGLSVGLLVGWMSGDVLAESVDKVRVRRLWVAPDPFDPVHMLTGRGADLSRAAADLSRADLSDLSRADLSRAVGVILPPGWAIDELGTVVKAHR